MRDPFLHRSFPLVLACALMACGDRSLARNAVELSRVVPLGLPAMDSVPVLRFGIPDSIGGASAEMGKAVAISDGGVAVGDWDGARVLVFDSLGALRRMIGRAGSGPGEFRNPAIVQSYEGDALLIWDPYLRRASYLSARTGKGDETTLATAVANGSAPLIGRLDDGRLVVKHEEFAPLAGTQGMAVTTSVRLLNAAGRLESTIVTLPAVPHGDAAGFRFFAPRMQVATDGERIFAGFSDHWEIGIWNIDGSRIGTLTRPWVQRAVTAQDRARIRAAITRPDMAPGFLDDDRFDAMVPAFGAILHGSDGTIWVLDYTPPYLSPDAVSVFDASGSLLTSLDLPEGFRPSSVSADWILGTATDAGGDFEVRRYRVRWVQQNGP